MNQFCHLCYKCPGIVRKSLVSQGNPFYLNWPNLTILVCNSCINSHKNCQDICHYCSSRIEGKPYLYFYGPSSKDVLSFVLCQDCHKIITSNKLKGPTISIFQNKFITINDCQGHPLKEIPIRSQTGALRLSGSGGSRRSQRPRLTSSAPDSIFVDPVVSLSDLFRPHHSHSTSPKPIATKQFPYRKTPPDYEQLSKILKILNNN